jgi:hypothetical protein
MVIQVIDTRDIQQIEHSIPADAKRVTFIDSTGTEYDASNPIPVYDTGGVSGVALSSFNEITVTYGNELTLISYTVPVGKTFGFSTINVGGDGDGIFNVYINSVKAVVIRTSAAEQSKSVVLENLIAPSGALILVRASNMNYKKTAQVYNATLTGNKI